jgi:hypothetical protein
MPGLWGGEMINVDFMERFFLPALEEFPQGKHCLKDADGSVCCLGAMTEVAIRYGLVEDRWEKYPVTLVNYVDGIEGLQSAYIVDGYIPDQEGGAGTRGLTDAMQALTGLDSEGGFLIENDEPYEYTIGSFSSPNLWTFNDGGSDFAAIRGAIQDACDYAKARA